MKPGVRSRGGTSTLKSASALATTLAALGETKAARRLEKHVILQRRRSAITGATSETATGATAKGNGAARTV